MGQHVIGALVAWEGRQGPLHPSLHGLFQMLPDSRSRITEKQLRQWLTAFESAARLVYDVVPEVEREG